MAEHILRLSEHSTKEHPHKARTPSAAGRLHLSTSDRPPTPTRSPINRLVNGMHGVASLCAPNATQPDTTRPTMKSAVRLKAAATHRLIKIDDQWCRDAEQFGYLLRDRRVVLRIELHISNRATHATAFKGARLLSLRDSNYVVCRRTTTE